MSDEKVLDKIRKLLAMANDDRGNDQERETALRMAHALLTKHGLDLQQVEASARDAVDPRGTFDFESWSMPWTREIRHYIGKLFMCEYIYGHKKSGTKQVHWYVGRESNAATAMYMSTYVIESILKEGRRLYTHNLSPETRSFAVGAVRRLARRIEGMIADKATEVGRGTGKELVLLELAEQEKNANLAFIADWDVKEKTPRKSEVDPRAYAKGVEYGGKIGLNVQIAKPDEQLKLEKI